MKRSKPGSNYDYDKVACGNMPFVYAGDNEAYWENSSGNTNVGPNGEKLVNSPTTLSVEMKVVKHDTEPQNRSLGYCGNEKAVIEVQSNNGKQYEEYKDSTTIYIEVPLDQSSVGKTFDVKGEVTDSGSNSGNNNSGNSNSGSSNSGNNNSGNSNSGSSNSGNNDSSNNNSGNNNSGTNETTTGDSGSDNSGQDGSGANEVTEGGGDSGQNSVTENVKLSKVKISRLKAGKKYIKVKWKKLSKKNQKKIKFIQVQYSKDKTFKTDVKTKNVSSKKSEVKLKNLNSGEKYYVRIRAYTKDGKTINVSKWSAYKSKKAK